VIDRRTFVSASCSAVLAGCLWPDRATAPEPPARAHVVAPLLGLNAHILSTTDRAHLSALRVTHVRLPAILQQWESSERHRVDLLNMSRWADEAGLHVLWYAHNIPEGYAEPARITGSAGWADRMERFVAHLRTLPATDAVQPWNEPDSWVQMPFGAAEGLNARHMGQLYGEHVGRMGSGMVTAGLADHRNARALPFLQGIMDTGVRPEAFAIHAYGRWERVRERLWRAREIVGDAPLWLTEFGNDRPEYDAAYHLACWRETVEGAAREGWVDRLYGYALPTDPRYPEHGLLETDGSPRPAYQWLQQRRAA
jgi:hypothetical protein